MGLLFSFLPLIPFHTHHPGSRGCCKEWFQELVEQGLSPDIVSYTTVMEAHARAGKMASAERDLA